MNKYVTKQKTVQAVQLDEENFDEVFTMVKKAQPTAQVVFAPGGGRRLHLPNVPMQVEIGEWLIRRSDDRWIKLTDVVFNSSYEAAK